MPLRFLTAGESHGPALTVIVDGVPAGVPVSRDAIDRDLRRRMGGYGRGGRMKIERDAVRFLGGVRHGRTLGSPVALLIENLDHSNWNDVMDPDGAPPDEPSRRAVTRPRPGHADLAGALKFGTHDARDILERASARETAARTAAGALVRGFLRELGIEITSRTVSVGGVVDDFEEGDFDAMVDLPDDAPLRCLSADVREAMIGQVERARREGDSIGGVFEVLARGVPPGLGSHTHWDRKIDGALARAIMSIQAIKAVAIGEGVEGAARRGSQQHDAIGYDAESRRFVRPSNRAGGVEGGVTNGEIVRALGYLKPLSTLPTPLESVDLVDKRPSSAARERTDTIPIVAAGVVGEAMVALVLADEMLRKFGGDALAETRRNLEAYRASLREF